MTDLEALNRVLDLAAKVVDDEHVSKEAKAAFDQVRGLASIVEKMNVDDDEVKKYQLIQAVCLKQGFQIATTFDKSSIGQKLLNRLTEHEVDGEIPITDEQFLEAIAHVTKHAETFFQAAYQLEEDMADYIAEHLLTPEQQSMAAEMESYQHEEDDVDDELWPDEMGPGPLAAKV